MNLYIDTDTYDSIIYRDDFAVFKTIDAYTQSKGAKKAIITAPFPTEKFSQFINLYETLYSISDKIIILVPELHDITVEFIKSHDNNKTVFFLCGNLNFDTSHAAVYQWMSWFESTVGFYQNNLHLLEKLNPYSVKPKYFDILLGQKRPHRDQIFSYINFKNYNPSVIMTYLETSDATRLNSELPVTNWIWGVDDIQLPDHPIQTTIDSVKYNGQTISLSQIIPIEIYNQTAYSVVAETWATDTQFTFNTEKIVKPILSERLFLVSGNQYYLRNLQKLGFKTFSEIIDESYDEEPRFLQRMWKICDQIDHLISRPQEEILEKTKSITQYNRRHMLETDWWGKLVENFIKELIN